jgi:hypothetical protein
MRVEVYGKMYFSESSIVSKPELTMLRLLSTHHPWVNWQRNPYIRDRFRTLSLLTVFIANQITVFKCISLQIMGAPICLYSFFSSKKEINNTLYQKIVLIGIDMLFSTKQGFLCQFTDMGCRR